MHTITASNGTAVAYVDLGYLASIGQIKREIPDGRFGIFSYFEVVLASGHVERIWENEIMYGINFANEHERLIKCKEIYDEDIKSNSR